MDKLQAFWLLIIGGAIGTTARFGVYLLADKWFSRSFPTGTLMVNLIGSFLIGLAWGYFDKVSAPPATRLFFLVGILGSFTTFSTFAFDSYNLLNQYGWGMMLINVLANNAGGLLLCMLGLYLTSSTF
ncbi:MAG TPA: fluoride efflux transporter CrcB [Bacteroidales bacterium]|nr:fluoride efflux transporter CrcB [Bacteroidales bacterium]